MMRQRHEQTRRRPGNMQEKADAIGQATVAQHLPKRNHVVVMHPDYVFRRGRGADRISEMLIHTVIVTLEGPGICCQVAALMKPRPSRPIGIAVVIFVYLMFFESIRRGLYALLLADAALAVENFGHLTT